MKLPWQRAALAEVFGTFSLVFVGCGAIVVDQQTQALGNIGIAASFGLVILIMVLSTGHVSGAHLNPAVTLAFLTQGRIGGTKASLYVVSQLVGAIAAAALLRFLFPLAAESSLLGSTMPRGSVSQTFVLEILLSAMLMFVIAAVATDNRAQGRLAAATAIGGVVALGALWGGPISGASMNPARSLGPALMSGAWQHHWLYWLAPCLGTVIGAGSYRILQDADSVAPP